VKRPKRNCQAVPFGIYKEIYLSEANMSRIHSLILPVIAIFVVNSGIANSLQSSVQAATLPYIGGSITVDEVQNKPEIIRKIEHPTREDIRKEIIRQAKKYGVSVEAALSVANCESGFVYNAANSGSTAKGVYQFLDGTWEWTQASGHQFDYHENIRQFMKWYPRVPEWWECHKILYGRA